MIITFKVLNSLHITFVNHNDNDPIGQMLHKYIIHEQYNKLQLSSASY